MCAWMQDDSFLLMQNTLIDRPTHRQIATLIPCQGAITQYIKMMRSVFPRVCNGFKTAKKMSTFSLPALPYDFGAIMEIHYTKHHNTYVTNLNAAHEKLGDAHAKGDINTEIALQPALKFNGGGHLNHSIFWENLAPVGQGGGEMVSGDLENMINTQFGSLDGLKKTMSASTIAIQGSGWGWLGYDKTAGQLRVATCANQDPLEATTGLVPLFGIDVWEHAYYLQYKNVRPDYVNGIWKIVNWRDVAARLEKAKSA